MQIHSAVSSASIQQMQKHVFSKADADGSGGVNLAEFKAIGKNVPAGLQAPTGAPDLSQVFGKLDADGNGEVTETELTNAPRPTFDAGMDQGFLQSLQESQNSLLDALFSQQDKEEAQKEVQGLSGGQDIKHLIDQYLANYLSLSANSLQTESAYTATV